MAYLDSHVKCFARTILNYRPRAPCPSGSLLRGARVGRLRRMALSERDRAMLDFERTWWSKPGSKEAGIRQRFGLSPARYYQVLAELSESAEALAYDPLVVRRLQRLRRMRRRVRFEGRPTGERPFP